jgi:hypothetical protein
LFPSELIHKYGSYKQLVEFLGRGISRRKAATYTQKKRGQIAMPSGGFESSVPVSEWQKNVMPYC